MKVCRRCGRLADRFPPNPATADGLSSWCRKCHTASCRESRAKHREQINARRRARYAARNAQDGQ